MGTRESSCLFCCDICTTSKFLVRVNSHNKFGDLFQHFLFYIGMQLRCLDTAEILFLWKLQESKSRKWQYTFMLLLECWLSPSKSLSILLQKIGLRSADGVSADRGGLFAVFCRRVAKCIRVPRLSCFLCFSCTRKTRERTSSSLSNFVLFCIPAHRSANRLSETTSHVLSKSFMLYHGNRKSNVLNFLFDSAIAGSYKCQGANTHLNCIPC